MDAEPLPIAYTALQPGTPVQSMGGHQFGTVTDVLVVAEVDVFDGLIVETADGRRFVDADYIGSIFTTCVCTTLADDDVVNLPPPDAAPVFRVDASDDTGTSISDRLGRVFGRGKWKQESK